MILDYLKFFHHDSQLKKPHQYQMTLISIVYMNIYKFIE